MDPSHGRRLPGQAPFPQHNDIWTLIPTNVEAHFCDNEGAWPDALKVADGFQRLPVGKKKKKKMVAEPVKTPDCVPGSLKLGFAAAGDNKTSASFACHSR